MRESGSVCGGGLVSGTLRRLRSASAGTRWTNPAERSQKFTSARKGNQTDQDSIGSSSHQSLALQCIVAASRLSL